MLKNFNQALCLSVLMIAGLMGTYTAPVLIGIFIDVMGFSEASAGSLVTVEIFAIALSAIVSSTFVARLSVKKVAVAAIAFLVLGQLLSAFVDQYLYLALLRSVVGVSSGVLLAIVNSIIARSGSPDRLYGQTLACSSIGFAVLLFALPYTRGFSHLIGLFGVLGLIVLSGIVVFAVLRDSLAVSGGVATKEIVPINFRSVFLFFAIITALYLVTGGTWAFTERVAKNSGIDNETLGVLLGLSTVAGIFGAATAAILNVRLGRILPTAIGFVVSGISCLLIIVSTDVWVFTIGVLIYGFSYMFTVAYVLSIGAALDRQGRVAVATNGYLLVPYSFGPGLFGYLGTNALQGIWYVPFLVCTVSALLICLVIYTIDEKYVEDYV